jgi:hypothetical protein
MQHHLSGTVTSVDFPYSLRAVTPQRFREFVDAMPHLREASFQGIDEEEHELGWDTNHPDWIAAQTTIRGRNSSDMRILPDGSVCQKDHFSVPIYGTLFEY